MPNQEERLKNLENGHNASFIEIMRRLLNGLTGMIKNDIFWMQKGDLAVGKSLRVAHRLPVGTDGQMLMADSTEEAGIRWGTGGSGSPAEPDKSIQWNNAGAFGGSAKLTWDDLTTTMVLGAEDTGGTLFVDMHAADSEDSFASSFFARAGDGGETGLGGEYHIRSGRHFDVTDSESLIELAGQYREYGVKIIAADGFDDGNEVLEGRPVLIQSGSAQDGDTNGGDILLAPGSASGTGRAGNIVINSDLPTSAEGGHLIIPNCAGTPTGNAVDGALILDYSNNKLYVRSGGSWHALN